MTSPFSASLICPFRTMFIASYPLIVGLAVLNEPNPRPGLTRRFMNLWSCSINHPQYPQEITRAGSFYHRDRGLASSGHSGSKNR